MAVYLDQRHHKMLKDILSQYPYTFYVFGSRAKGNPKPFSDIDLCFKEEIAARDLLAIEEALEESDLPFTVDLVDWNKCSVQFQKMIENDLVKL